MRPLALLLFTLSISVALAQEPPSGWRVPTAEAFRGQDLRSNSPTNYLSAAGDFDGDGQSDRAELLLAENELGEGLFVQLSSAASGGWILAAEERNREPMAILRMGVSIAPPGSYLTACGKGYWECRDGEPSELQLETDGLRYFRFESGASIVYWDVRENAFRQVWISD